MGTNKYIKRFYLLILLILLGVFFIFQLSIRPTLQLKNEIERAELELGNSNYYKELQGLREKHNSMDTYFKEVMDVKEKEAESWDFIVRTADSLSVHLIHFPEIHLSPSKMDYRILSQEIGLKANFADIVRFIHAMEQERKVFLHSASFYLEKNRKTNEEYLITKLYLQQIIR